MNIYFQDYYADDSIDIDEAYEADLELALELFYELYDEKDNFFGITDDSNGKTIQFMYIKQDTWLVDIPDMENAGSWQKRTDYDECVNFIRSFYERKPIDTTDFSFESFPLEEKEREEMIAIGTAASQKEKEREEQVKAVEEKEREWQRLSRLEDERYWKEQMQKSAMEDKKNKGHWSFWR
jgi:hypothetical protein